jgi:hypothetical protein
MRALSGPRGATAVADADYRATCNGWSIASSSVPTRRHRSGAPRDRVR